MGDIRRSEINKFSFDDNNIRTGYKRSDIACILYECKLGRLHACRCMKQLWTVLRVSFLYFKLHETLSIVYNYHWNISQDPAPVLYPGSPYNTHSVNLTR